MLMINLQHSGPIGEEPPCYGELIDAEIVEEVMENEESEEDVEEGEENGDECSAVEQDPPTRQEALMSLMVVRSFLQGICVNTTTVDTVEGLILGAYDEKLVQKQIEEMYGQ